eukprot:s2418_g3.t2
MTSFLLVVAIAARDRTKIEHRQSLQHLAKKGCGGPPAPWRMRRMRLLPRLLWLTAAACGFFVPLDSGSIQALFGRFALLEPPSAVCPGDDDGSWHPFCAFGLSEVVECEYNGYQYSMEWYFMEMLRNGPQYLASSPEEAEFIYFPHCVSQLYFALRENYNYTHWQAIERAELGYLVPILRWAHRSPVHQKYQGRNFWTVFSMDLGRQDFPRSAVWLENWSVGSLTGSATWMQDAKIFFTEPDGPDCWKLDTEPVAVANHMFPARNFRVQDTVISIPSRFSPHPRSRRFGGRPVLAFFAGSPNSCARERIVKVLANEPGFDVSTSFATSSEDYSERMWRARFCFVLRGSSHTNNVRLYDVIAHGCVPIIDMAIFLPTSSIPRLAHILRHEVTEEHRWRYFRNIALGSPQGAKGFPEDLERSQQMASSLGLDKETLWSGLSASRVFDWHDSHFWLLFYADVAAKLRERILLPAAKRTRPAQAQRWMLVAVRWLLDLERRRENRAALVVECGNSDADATRSIFGEELSNPPLRQRKCNVSETSRSTNVVLKVSSQCESEIWQLLLATSPRILWLDFSAFGRPSELCRDLAFAGWLCFSEVTLQPLFEPFVADAGAGSGAVCGQEEDPEFQKVIDLLKRQLRPKRQRWGAQFTSWAFPANTRGRFLH